MQIVLAFDPGLKGGVCALGIDEQTSKIKQVLHIAPLPLTAEELVDLRELRKVFTALKKLGDVFAFLERAQPMHKAPVKDVVHRDGSKQAFTTGRNYGRLEVILEANEIPYVEFTPQKWQNNIFKGMSKDLTTKERSVIVASKRFPAVNLVPKRCRNPHDGMSDALCIALYGVGLIKAGEVNV